jgi:hypothetical protein
MAWDDFPERPKALEPAPKKKPAEMIVYGKVKSVYRGNERDPHWDLDDCLWELVIATGGLSPGQLSTIERGVGRDSVMIRWAW